MSFKNDAHRKAVMAMLGKKGKKVKVKFKVFDPEKAKLRNPVSVPYAESKRTLQGRKRLHQQRRRKKK
jgi:hypothetical protein